MKRFFRLAGEFLWAFPQIIVFELLYKLVLTALGAPFLGFLLRITMEHAGVGYLSAESLTELLKSPVTLISVFLTLFVVAFFTLVELCALIACFACRRHDIRLSPYGMLKAGLSSFAKAFRGRGIFSFICFMIIIPLAQFTLSSGVFFAPVTPMLRSLMKPYGSYLYLIILAVIMLGGVYLLAERCYSLHYLALTDTPFWECSKKSRKCLEGKKLRTAISLLIWSLMLALSVLIIVFLLSFVIISLIKGFAEPEAALNSALKILSYTGEVLYVISAIISAPVIICGLTSAFISDTMQTEKLILTENKPSKLPKPAKAFIMLALAGAGVFLNFSYLQELYKGNTVLNSGLFTSPRITAHRGFSYAAPENTSYAFEAAIDADADYIELDVQQSADGQLVVFHDSLLDRTTDGTGAVASFTYEELSKLSCGSWFKKGDFSDARILLLSEALELYGDDILLNIEIKNEGDVLSAATKTAQLIMEYKLTDSCYVTSFSYQALKEVKDICPEIKTGIISNSAAAAVYSQLLDIDAVSLNYNFVNQHIISTAHKNGKKVFVWTVNGSEDIERMISLGADNIITDRPDIATEVVYSYGIGDFVLSVLKRVFGTSL